MAEPTIYDLAQDDRIGAVEGLVTPSYTPPEAGERSFPVVGQGIDSEQYRLMSLAQGDGIIVTGNGTNSHLLAGLPGGAAETNSQNQMILQVAQNTGRGEAILGGYYHVFYQDMRLNFPPVTTPTTYHVCITRDPRNENQNNHLFIDVYAGTPPTANNRTHIILHTVHREPNQLLTDATRQTFRQIVSPAITVATPEQLPDSTTVAHQTLGIVRNQGVTEGTGQLFESRGVSGWKNLLVGPWEDIRFLSSWNGSYGKVRHRAGGIDVAFRASNINTPSNVIFSLPEGYRLSRAFFTNVFSTEQSATRLEVGYDTQGEYGRLYSPPSTVGYVNGSFFIPDYYLA